MRSEFQDVFKDAYGHWIDDACSHRYHTSKSLALQVWQHQQSKVDELQKNINLLNKALDIKEQLNQKLREREGKLQKQINDSIFILSTIDNPDEAYISIDLLLRALRGEQALKGENK